MSDHPDERESGPRANQGHPRKGLGPGSEPPVIAKLYDLILWYAPVLSRFKRDARYSLGERLMGALLDAHLALADAAYGRQRGVSLAEAARQIDRARLLSRLSHDLALIDHRRYEYASERLVEVGRMIGGWRKHDGARQR